MMEIFECGVVVVVVVLIIVVVVVAHRIRLGRILA